VLVCLTGMCQKQRVCGIDSKKNSKGSNATFSVRYSLRRDKEHAVECSSLECPPLSVAEVKNEWIYASTPLCFCITFAGMTLPSPVGWSPGVRSLNYSLGC
jgi:hypothetical protein